MNIPSMPHNNEQLSSIQTAIVSYLFLVTNTHLSEREMHKQAVLPRNVGVVSGKNGHPPLVGVSAHWGSVRTVQHELRQSGNNPRDSAC